MKAYFIILSNTDMGSKGLQMVMLTEVNIKWESFLVGENIIGQMDPPTMAIFLRDIDKALASGDHHKKEVMRT